MNKNQIKKIAMKAAKATYNQVLRSLAQTAPTGDTSQLNTKQLLVQFIPENVRTNDNGNGTRGNIRGLVQAWRNVITNVPNVEQRAELANYLAGLTRQSAAVITREDQAVQPYLTSRVQRTGRELNQTELVQNTNPDPRGPNSTVPRFNSQTGSGTRR